MLGLVAPVVAPTANADRSKRREVTDFIRVNVTPSVSAMLRLCVVRAGEAIRDFFLFCELDQNVISLNDPFFAKQVRVVLSETGRINPDKLEDYIAHGGYQALATVLESMTPEKVCNEILESGLRGRGGAGYLTGTKWNFVSFNESDGFE